MNLTLSNWSSDSWDVFLRSLFPFTAIQLIGILPNEYFLQCNNSMAIFFLSFSHQPFRHFTTLFPKGYASLFGGEQCHITTKDNNLSSMHSPYNPWKTLPIPLHFIACILSLSYFELRTLLSLFALASSPPLRSFVVSLGSNKPKPISLSFSP